MVEGTGTSGTTLIQLGSCTIPAGTLGVGDRLEIQFDYQHTGSIAGFTGDVRVGGTTVATRSGGASEALFVGHTNFGIYTGGQVWDTDSWGSVLSVSSAAGGAGESVGSALTISFRGQMGAAGSDSVSLRNFSVIRYPAQVSP